MSPQAPQPVQLLVGLANPGAQYQKTRHNAGAWFINQICDREQAELAPEKKTIRTAL